MRYIWVKDRFERDQMENVWDLVAVYNEQERGLAGAYVYQLKPTISNRWRYSS